MKPLSVLILLISFSALAQNSTFQLTYSKIISTDEFGPNERNYKWVINGREVNNEIDQFKLETNYPNMDTIVFSSNDVGHNSDTIYTRFYPDSSFIFTIGCCNEGFDMFLVSDYQEIVKGTEASSDLFWRNKEKTELTLKTHQYSKSDSLFVLYGDFGQIPLTRSSELLSKKMNFKFPEKTEESNTIQTLVISEIDVNNEIVLESYDQKKFRFFGSEKLIVDYFTKTKDIKLKIK